MAPVVLSSPAPCCTRPQCHSHSVIRGQPVAGARRAPARLDVASCEQLLAEKGLTGSTHEQAQRKHLSRRCRLPIERKVERSAAVGFRISPYPAAMPANGAFHERQADTGSFVVVGRM